MNTQAKGAANERRVLKELLADGWVATRARLMGSYDIMALKAGERPMLVQVKSGARPYAHFLPKDRAELILCAERAGAVAMLAWVPPRRATEWLDQAVWP